MKKRNSDAPAAVKAACTVSAAALMLGVSHAATVGFNFQTHYCSAASYNGAVVTAPAFGVGTNSWENLSQMDTGYGCDAGPFTLNEAIDTTTSSDGLNPLPTGSLNVTWTGYVANVSGFGGYDRNPPHYNFGGPGYHPGEEQVYWGFIRDGVNFGPGSSGGDNNQPGYSIDITGLKSVFTNGFVVELIASSDSMDTLTNAFIIDATLQSTQTVAYPNTAPVGNVGDTAWVRGIGGGLSTSSGAVNTDHLQIVGARAEHSADPAFNRASTISGFILTDKPVVTMAPQPVLGGKGDDVTLRAIAIGLPPLSLQWQKDGVSIANATNASYEIPSLQLADAGVYTLVATNAYGSTVSKPAKLDVSHLVIAPQPFVADSKPSGAAIDGADRDATWLASSQDSGGKTRTGVMSFNETVVPGTAINQIILPGSTNFDSPVGTISFWVRSGATNPTAGNQGSMLFDRRTGSGAVIVKQDDGTILVQPNGNGNSATSVNAINDGKWHQVAVVFDNTDTGGITIYVDGALDTQNANSSAWPWPTGQEIELGLSHDSYWRAFDGQLDDFRIYNRLLSGDEVASIFSSDAIVDASALEVRLNFDAAPFSGVSISWSLSADVLQSADVVTGPYTDVPGGASTFYSTAPTAKKFYRALHTTGAVLSNPYDM